MRQGVTEESVSMGPIPGAGVDGGDSGSGVAASRSRVSSEIIFKKQEKHLLHRAGLLV